MNDRRALGVSGLDEALYFRLTQDGLETDHLLVLGSFDSLYGLVDGFEKFRSLLPVSGGETADDLCLDGGQLPLDGGGSAGLTEQKVPVGFQRACISKGDSPFVTELDVGYTVSLICFQGRLGQAFSRWGDKEGDRLRLQGDDVRLLQGNLLLDWKYHISSLLW